MTSPEGEGDHTDNEGSEDEGELDPTSSEIPDAQYVDEAAHRAAERVVGAYWSGPLPPPAMLQEYDSVLPGLAERIVGMAEGEQGHRHGMDRALVTADSKVRTRAQWFAFGLGGVALVVALVFGLTGYPLAGFGTVLLGLGAIIGAFVSGRSQAPELPADPGTGIEQASASE